MSVIAPVFLIYLSISAIATFLLGALLVLYLTRCIVGILEVLTRKIAESPKGPLLAVSALVGGVASIAKAFH